MALVPQCDIESCGHQSVCFSTSTNPPTALCSNHLQSHQSHSNIYFHLHISRNQAKQLLKAIDFIQQDYTKQIDSMILKSSAIAQEIRNELEKLHSQTSNRLKTITHNFLYMKKALTSLAQQRNLSVFTQEPLYQAILECKTTQREFSIDILLPLLSKLTESHTKFELNTRQISTCSVFQNRDQLEILKKDKQKLYFSLSESYTTCLQLSEQEILITGGLDKKNWPVNSVNVLSLKTRKLRRLPCFKYKRFRHALGWLQNKPAIIGGLSAGDIIRKSVQIYDGKQWCRGASLNIARYDLSVCSSANATYAIGGRSTKEKYGTLIEKFCIGKWDVLDIELPGPLALAGSIGFQQKILILGGIDQEQKYEVFQINLKEKNVQNLGSLRTKSFERTFSFTESEAEDQREDQLGQLNNLWIVKKRQIEGFVSGRSLVRFKIPKFYK